MENSSKKDVDDMVQADNENMVGKAEEPKSENIGLQAKMSLVNGCTVIVGSIIGSGIFVSPTGVLRYTGSVNMALIVWVISGLFSMVSLPICVVFLCRLCR